MRVALEWAYIPALVRTRDRGMLVLAPFSFGPSAERSAVLTLLAVRVACVGALALISVMSVLLYALAYVLFLTCCASWMHSTD